MVELGESKQVGEQGQSNEVTPEAQGPSSADVILGAINQLPWVGRPLANFGGFILGATEGFFETTGMSRAVERLGAQGAVENINSEKSRQKSARSRADSIGKIVNSADYARNTDRFLARQAVQTYLERVLLDQVKGEDKILARKELTVVIGDLPVGESYETIGLTNYQLAQLKKHL